MSRALSLKKTPQNDMKRTVSSMAQFSSSARRDSSSSLMSVSSVASSTGQSSRVLNYRHCQVKTVWLFPKCTLFQCCGDRCSEKPVIVREFDS